MGAPRSGSQALGSFGFTGEQQDSETGFVYLRARHDDPATGQFMQEDSYAGALPDPASQHRYGYARGNPLAYTDPSGHDPLDRLAEHEAAVRGACLAAGDQPAACYGYGLAHVKALVGDTGGGTAIDPFDPVSAFRDGSPVDKAICVVTTIGSGGASIVRGVLKVGGKSFGKLFANAGIKVRDHFLWRLAGRGVRGVTEEAALQAYNHGRLYYNPATKNYIRHDPTTRVSVAVDKPSGGEVITVFEGKPSPDWQLIPWRPGSP